MVGNVTTLVGIPTILFYIWTKTLHSFCVCTHLIHLQPRACILFAVFIFLHGFLTIWLKITLSLSIFDILPYVRNFDTYDRTIDGRQVKSWNRIGISRTVFWKCPHIAYDTRNHYLACKCLVFNEKTRFVM